MTVNALLPVVATHTAQPARRSLAPARAAGWLPPLASEPAAQPVAFLGRLRGAGIPAGEADLLSRASGAILAGENDYTTESFEQITGRSSRPLAEFLHEHRAEFV